MNGLATKVDMCVTNTIQDKSLSTQCIARHYSFAWSSHSHLSNYTFISQ